MPSYILSMFLCFFVSIQTLFPKTMSQVYIQCNGFRQFAKVSAFLLAYPTDVRYSDVSVSIRLSGTHKKYEIYLLSFPHVDPIGFWEFLMDYAPIPDRFVSCDEIEHTSD